MSESYYDMFLQGGIIIVILAILSIISLAIIIERLVYIYKSNVRTDTFFAELINSVKSGDKKQFEKTASRERDPLSSIIEKLRPETSNLKSNKELAAEAIAEADANLKRRTHALIFIVQLAPLLGILGTVLGLAEAFLSIGNLGGTEKFQMLSAGIGKALSTTIAGLVIAAYTMCGHYLIRYRTSKNLAALTKKLSDYVKTISVEDEKRTA